MSAKHTWAFGMGACALFLLVAWSSSGCASGQSINQQVSDGGGSSESSASAMGGLGGDGGGELGGAGGMGAEGGEGGMGAEGGAGGMDPCALGCPADTWDLDQNPLTGECGCEYLCEQTSANDPIDEDFTDENCDGTDGVVEDCVFVSASDGSSAGNGTPGDPLDTIANGIAFAQANDVSAVCVSGETYNEAVTMVSGISVYGGFDHEDVDFKFRRKDTVTSAVRALGTVFLAANILEETHIEGLTIEAFTPAIPGESTYGVRLTGGSADLYVRYNVIHAFAGADGDFAGNGTAHAANQAPPGNDGGDGCEADDNPCDGDERLGGAQTTCPSGLFGGKGGNGNLGGDGDDGQAGNGGTPAGGAGGDRRYANLDNFCSLTAPAAFHGVGGTNNINHGNNGNPGGAGNDIGSVSNGAYAPANGGNGVAGTHGAGGPGGGGGGGEAADVLCGLAISQDAGAGGGSGGCGGQGGDFGRGGGGGGGSFGVFAAGGRVIVTDNDITTDGGGDGADGGTGQRGQTGGLGGQGGDLWDDGGNGGDGGNGSNGGHGGPGGGGGGGPCAILGFAPGVIFTMNGNSTALGSAGNGGDGGTHPISGVTAPAGDDGVNGVTLQIN